jgi:carboxypeptidase T
MAQAQAGDYSGHLRLRVQAGDVPAVARVMALAEHVLTHDPAPGSLEIVVAPEALATLRNEGFAPEVLSSDFGAEVAAERARIDAPRLPSYQQLPTPEYPLGTFFDTFRTYAELDAYLDQLAAVAPDRVQVVPVGTSLEGRAIRGLRFSTSAGERPAILITGTQHAREWLSPMVTTCFADVLSRDYPADPDVKMLLDRLELFIIPVVNPDGYEYSRTTDRLWRKNRRDDYGVDLNRNWSAGFNTAGTTDTSSELYQGPSALSEPETTAVRDFMVAHPQLVAFLDYHTPAQMIAYPLAYTSTPPANIDMILDWAQRMSTAIGAVYGLDHHLERTGVMDPTGGLAADYAVSELGLIGLTPEMRKGTSEGGFGIEPSQIGPACRENLAGLFAVAVPLAEKSPAPPGTPPVTPTPDAGVPDAGPTAGTGGAPPAQPPPGMTPPTMTPTGTSPLDAGTGLPPTSVGLDPVTQTGAASSKDSSGCNIATSPAATSCGLPGWLAVGFVFLAARRLGGRRRLRRA